MFDKGKKGKMKKAFRKEPGFGVARFLKLTRGGGLTK